MSAQLNDLSRGLPKYRDMTAADLGAVMAIENDIYPYPWTRGNFSDSLNAGYQCWVMHVAGEIIGYCVMMVGVGEVHLLNISIARRWQRRGYGRTLLGFVAQRARELGARMVLLEVRVSNTGASRLYLSSGFRAIGTRRAYYPADNDNGREDALVMELVL